MKNIYTQYCHYNLWANRRLTAIFKDLPEEKTNQFIENSFPSVKKTILHIWDAEIIWLTRLKGGHIDYFPSTHFSGSTVEAIEGLLSTSGAFLEFVEMQQDDFFASEIAFQTTSGTHFNHRAADMIHHCLNHSTYHRGQLLTMARQLGIASLVSTDMIFYLREGGRVSRGEGG